MDFKLNRFTELDEWRSLGAPSRAVRRSMRDLVHSSDSILRSDPDHKPSMPNPRIWALHRNIFVDRNAVHVHHCVGQVAVNARRDWLSGAGGPVNGGGLFAGHCFCPEAWRRVEGLVYLKISQPGGAEMRGVPISMI